MDMLELVLKLNESTHQQTIARLKMRDNILLVYLAATASIFGISLGAEKISEITLIIPYLALGVAILYSHHNLFIGAALDYSSKELKKFIRNKFPNESIPSYHTSHSFRKFYSPAMWLMAIGSFILIIVPCIITLVFNFHYILSGESIALNIIWFLSFMCTIISTIILSFAHRLRMSTIKNGQFLLDSVMESSK